jgi:L-lactate dehydrogenase complex protein LldG
MPPVPVVRAGSSVPAQLEIPLAPVTETDALVRRFTAALEQAGGTAVEGADLAALRLPPAGDGPRRGVVSCAPGLPVSTLTIGPDAPRERLDQIGLAIVPARFGVAENGAVWVDERDLPHRAVPFIAERLVVILPKREIVADLHQAYRRLRPPLPGYGVFIAGPSKTADIEQALVIGAQGPKSLVVLLT